MAEKITIMGAGHQGLTMAAHLSSNGVNCYIWNRTKSHITEVMKSKKIVCKGIINKEVPVCEISDDITKVLQKNIMVATPSSAHRDIAHLLAPYVDDTYTIILNPGRTFGILDFIHALEEAGCESIPCIAETQTIVYTCRRDELNGVRLYALKKGVPIAALNYSDMPRVMASIPSCLRDYFLTVESYIETSLGNVGMILHCAPVLMNIGWIENKKVQFEYYYDGITPTIADLLERLDQERISISSAMGHKVETVVEWLQRTYGTNGSNLYENLQNNSYYRGIDAPASVHHRYLEEDIPNGLVALESIGEVLGIKTPITSTIISFANITMNCDYRQNGRRYVLLEKIEHKYKRI